MSQCSESSFEMVRRVEMEEAMADLSTGESAAKQETASASVECGTPRSGIPRARFGGGRFSRSASSATLGGSVHDGNDGLVSNRGSMRSIASFAGNNDGEGETPVSGFPRLDGSAKEDEGETPVSGFPREHGPAKEDVAPDRREITCYKCRLTGHHYRNCASETAPEVVARNRQRKLNVDAFMASEARQKERIRQDRQREDERPELRQREERLALAEKRVREDRQHEDGEKDRLRFFRSMR